MRGRQCTGAEKRHRGGGGCRPGGAPHRGGHGGDPGRAAGGLNRPPELPEALRLEESFSLTRALDSYERELLSRAMQQAGSISQAARLLGLSRQNLKYKLKKFDL